MNKETLHIYARTSLNEQSQTNGDFSIPFQFSNGIGKANELNLEPLKYSDEPTTLTLENFEDSKGFSELISNIDNGIVKNIFVTEVDRFTNDYRLAEHLDALITSKNVIVYTTKKKFENGFLSYGEGMSFWHKPYELKIGKIYEAVITETILKDRVDCKNCESNINIDYNKNIPPTFKRFCVESKKLISEILSKNVKRFYIGATHDYTQRFCGDGNQNNPVTINSHCKNGYTKMYVLGNTNLHTTICHLEEYLLKNIDGNENKSKHSDGINSGFRKYYIYVVVEE